MNKTEKKLLNYLNMHWLRPEKALFMTLMSKSFQDIPLKSPSLEISCGDGLTMFTHLGGELSINFDVFTTTKAKKFRHDSYLDIFDHYEKSYKVKIIKKPKTKIDFGLDWKEDLLKKSEKLDLYKKLVKYDINKIPLPFKNNSFNTVYSNSIYWVNNVEEVLVEINRIVHPDGKVLLHVLTPEIYNTLKKLEHILTLDAIKILDRKRMKFTPSQFETKKWTKIIKNAGFKIVETRDVFPNTFPIHVWNIGLRPISHILVQMSQKLTENEKKKIKKEWVKIFYELFRPMLKLEKDHSINKSPYLLYILKK